MIDFENAIFTQIHSAATAAFPDAMVYGEPPSVPPALPCVVASEIDNATARYTLDSSGAENHADVTWQVDVYDNRLPDRKARCKAILSAIDERMREMGFVRTMRESIPNLNDDTIYRMTARYTARIGKDFTIYRR